MNPRTTLITTAVMPEAQPLIRRLALRRTEPTPAGAPRFEGVYLGEPLQLLVTGMGVQRAALAAGEWMEQALPRRVLITGVAGALRDDLRIGDVIVPAHVIDGASGDRLRPPIDANAHGALVTVDELASSPQRKTALRHAYQAMAVDMESAAVARLCDVLRVPWLCVPAGFMNLVAEDGTPRLGASVAYALTRPHRIPALVTMGRHTATAAGALADRLMQLL